MEKIVLLLALTFTALILPSTGISKDEECNAELEIVHAMDLSVSIVKNSTGDWVGSFDAKKSAAITANGVNLDIKQTVHQCKNRTVFRIKGTVHDILTESHGNGMESKTDVNAEKVVQSENTTCKEFKEDDGLRFQEKKGKNAVLINNGRTAYRNNSTSDSRHSTLVTNRPLKEDELFVVRLDKIINKWPSYPVVFGVVSNPPPNIEDLVETYSNKNGTWVIAWKSIRHDARDIKSDYGIDTSNLKVGDRLGVKRKSNGDLHFYLNGYDKGVAASNVPAPVYGILDIMYYSEQFTIVD